MLIINYSMDEDSNVLAWQASIVKELANHCEKVIVLTEHIGKFEPPKNVIVHLIPSRPWGIPKILGSRLLMNFAVSRLIRKHHIDICFVHMAMEWTYRLFPVMKLHHIPILLWYAHGTVSNRLRLAHACATRVVTSTPEGFRLQSKKKIVIGQGINTDLFNIPAYSIERNDILYVGRISPRKRVLLLVQVMALIRKISPQLSIRLKLLGPVLSKEDREYLNEIQSEIKRSAMQNYVEFLGDMSQHKIPLYYKNAFLHLNLSQTGSMDKTVMEALACGCPVLTSNEAFGEFLSGYSEFILGLDDRDAIVQKVLFIYENYKKYDPEILRNLIVGHHDTRSYASKIYQIFKNLIVGEEK